MTAHPRVDLVVLVVSVAVVLLPGCPSCKEDDFHLEAEIPEGWSSDGAFDVYQGDSLVVPGHFQVFHDRVLVEVTGLDGTTGTWEFARRGQRETTTW